MLLIKESICIRIKIKTNILYDKEQNMKRLHLICNAHIDPIWQWTWDEGIASAIATFKSAADLCDEFDYIFCHGESLLYEAIEKYDRPLFERIRELVKVGKWCVSGGWYLQPDVLMPHGETIIRHIKVGREYFKEKFDTTPTVATNFDSFGHSVGLVQILKKCGFVGYLACRPRGGDQFEYPSRFYRWRGPDGSEIIATQTFSYNSPLGKAKEKIIKSARGRAVGMLGSDTSAITDNAATADVDYVLWGVGNHGGGPSRKDLSDIASLKIEDTELLHSTFRTLFSDNIEIGGEVNTSLVTCMPGCYSSMARVKSGFRRCENMLLATEKMLSAANLAGMTVDYAPMREAEKRLLLATFHDTLPGTIVEEAEREALSLLGSVERAMRDYRTEAFLYLTIGERIAGEGEFPVFVFNYMPYEISTPCEVEFSLADQNWSEEYHLHPIVYDELGNEIPSQLIKENSTLNLDWRKKLVFIPTLFSLGITRFNIKLKKVPIVEKKATPVSNLEGFLKDTIIGAPAEFDMYSDTADPWGMSNEELVALGHDPKPFRLMTEREAAELFASGEPISPIRIIEDGDIYTSYEALYTNSNTRAVISYMVYKTEPIVDIKITLEFLDKNKLVRVKFKLPEGYGDIVGDGPYVWERKPKAGEITFQRWVGGMNEQGEIFSIINDGIYAGKYEDGYLHLTLIRGAGYCFHPIGDRPLYPTDRYLPRIDAGRYTYNLRIIKGDAATVNRAAEEFNQPPYAINLFPTGGRNISAPRIMVDGNVTVSVIKKASDGILVRIYNPAEQCQPFVVTLGDKTASDIASPREIVSVKITEDKIEFFHENIIF